MGQSSGLLTSKALESVPKEAKDGQTSAEQPVEKAKEAASLTFMDKPGRRFLRYVVPSHGELAKIEEGLRALAEAQSFSSDIVAQFAGKLELYAANGDNPTLALAKALIWLYRWSFIRLSSAVVRQSKAMWLSVRGRVICSTGWLSVGVHPPPPFFQCWSRPSASPITTAASQTPTSRAETEGRV